MKRRLLPPVALALLLGSAAAEPPPRDLANFVRLVHYQTSREDPGRWIGQASVRELRQPETEVSVTLLALTHIGRKDYYGSLTPHLRDADTVLAEGHGGEVGANSVEDADLPKDALWVRRSHKVCARLLNLIEQGDWESSVADGRWALADMGRSQVLEAVEKGRLPFPDALKPVVERWEAALSGSAPAVELARARDEASANIMRSFHEPPSHDAADLHEELLLFARERASLRGRDAVRPHDLVTGAEHRDADRARRIGIVNLG